VLLPLSLLASAFSIAAALQHRRRLRGHRVIMLVVPEDETQKSDEGQTGSPQAAGRAWDRKPLPAGL
jgi:hypothetical protein